MDSIMAWCIITIVMIFAVGAMVSYIAVTKYNKDKKARKR